MHKHIRMFDGAQRIVGSIEEQEKMIGEQKPGGVGKHHDPVRRVRLGEVQAGHGGQIEGNRARVGPQRRLDCRTSTHTASGRRWRFLVENYVGRRRNTKLGHRISAMSTY